MKLSYLIIIIFLSACPRNQPLTEPSSDPSPKVLVHSDNFNFKEEGPSHHLSHRCSFTYSQGARPQSFTELIKGSAVNILDRYKQLFSENYENKIANSQVGVYQAKNGDDSKWLERSLLSLSQNGVHVAIEDKPYAYEKDHTYVDFANRLIGGGVLNGGFVQEEIELLESTFLPWVSYVRNNKSFLPGCLSGPSLLQLDKVPVVVRLRIFAHINGHYGRPNSFDSQTLVSDYAAVESPVDIFTLAMAAPHLNPKGEYTQENLESLFLTAARGFYTALLVMHEAGLPLRLHTGNWGAGAFGNNVRMVAAIQYLAIQVAYLQFQAVTGQDPGVNYEYDSFNSASKKLAQKAIDTVKESPEETTPRKVLEALLRYTQTQPKWQLGGDRK